MGKIQGVACGDEFFEKFLFFSSDFEEGEDAAALIIDDEQTKRDVFE